MVTTNESGKIGSTAQRRTGTEVREVQSRMLGGAVSTYKKQQQETIREQEDSKKKKEKEFSGFKERKTYQPRETVRGETVKEST